MLFVGASMWLTYRYDRFIAIHRFMWRPDRRMFVKRRVSLHWMRTS